MMTTKTQTPANPLVEIAERIREMREIIGYSPAQMAERTEVTEELYRSYETGTVDLPFTFLHKCAVAFGMKKESARAANYFKSLGIARGDRVMLVLKRHYQFWFAILGLHKLGAVAIPATNQLLEHDFTYRFQTAGVSAIVCTADGETADAVDRAALESPTLKTKILVGGQREGWHDFNADYTMDGRQLSWLPSYGPEMRGGTANCNVILSDTPVGSPIVSRPNVLMPP